MCKKNVNVVNSLLDKIKISIYFELRISDLS